MLPLEGIKVLDLTRALAGPFCAMILADMGADVIKVEPSPDGDMIRAWGPFVDGISAYYLSCNRNKRGIAMDFRKPESLALLADMAGEVDVVLENFKVGTVEAMGLDYDTLAARNPRLIYGSVTGFGRTGPASGWPGFDGIAQGYAGLMSITGMPETGPTRVGVAVGDMTSGMWCAIGVLGAIQARHQTGRGQRVDTSLLASLVNMLSVQGQRYLSTGQIPGLNGNAHPVIVPYGVFETQNGPLSIAPATAQMWRNLCEVLERTDLLDDPRCATNEMRMENSAYVKREIESALMKRPRAEWTERMLAVGIPAGPINTIADVFADEQVRHIGLMQEVAHPAIGILKQIANPISMDGMRNDGGVRKPPPMLGEHTLDVLAEFGIDETERRRLLDADIVKVHAVADPTKTSATGA